MEKQEIIQIKQLPVIIERLQIIKQEVDAKVKEVTSLVCTEETVKEVKKARSELRKELEYWESERKKVKQAIMAPYDEFEKTYKEAISEPFKNADAELKEKISAVENELLTVKAEKVKAFFEEYAQSKSVDFVSLEKLGVKVTLSASLKSLKDKVKESIDKISDDIKLIETQEYSDEMLFEYKKSLNVSQAVTAVTDRHKAIEEQKAKAAELEERRKREQEASTVVKTIVNEVEPPKVESDPVRTVAFKVTAKMSKLKELKKFLDNGGYKYE